MKNILFVVGLLLAIVEASHFRYGTVSFTKSVADPRIVTYKYDLAMRRSYWGAPVVGTQLSAGNVYVNNGNVVAANFIVTNVDATNDIVYATYTRTFTFSGPGSFYSYFYSNARISNLNNNANGDFTFGATVVLTAAEIARTVPVNNSPVSGLLPVVSAPYNNVPYSFQIVASDPENDALSFRLSTQNEMSGTNPAGLSTSASGLVTLSSVLAQGFWSTQQVISDTYGQNVAVDYLINVVPTLRYCSGPCGSSGTCYTNGDCNSCGSCLPANPAIVLDPIGSGAAYQSNKVAPPAGSTIFVTTGNTITVSFVAYDSNLPFGSTIVMYTSGVSNFVTITPQSACDAAHGCVFVGNYTRPQLLSFTATPPASANGTVSTICVGVTSNGNALTYSQHCVNLAISAPVSVCGNNIVEPSEQCDGGACCSSTCTFKSAASTCRASAGGCDVAETCTGSSASCPADSFTSSAVTCRAAAGGCDVAETCTGSSASCPADSFTSSSQVCRAANGDCDVAETCTGSSASCPADSFTSSAVTCRAAAGDCDVAETCTGSSASCPADSFASSGATCRAAAGDCDVAETCTGSSASCPADSFIGSTQVCRAAAGDCDVAESCSGSSASCPTDSFVASSQVCRASAGVCDAVETCTGSSASCPTDSLASSSTICRAKNGSCDVAETCTGSSLNCPIDAISTTGYCQSATNVCPRVSNTAGSNSEFYCNVANRAVYFMCYTQVANGIVYPTYLNMPCAGGTTCQCPYGVDCSQGGTVAPCTV